MPKVWLDNRFGPVANFTRLGSFVLCHMGNLNKSYGPSKLSVYYHALDPSSKLSFTGYFRLVQKKSLGVLYL